MDATRTPPPRAWTIAVAATAFAVYLPTGGHGFAFDDAAVVVQNPYVRSLDHVPEIFRSNEFAGSGLLMRAYRPLTTVSFALEHAVLGGAPWHFHLVNAALHALATVLLVLVAAELGLPAVGAVAAGLLFALHPIHVEAVSNVAGRKDVLAAGFALATVLAHRRGTRRGGAWLAVAPALAAAAMLSKESGIVAPGLALLADLAVPGLPAGDRAALRRRLGLYAAYAAVAAGYVALLLAATRGAQGVPFVDNPAAHASVLVRVATAVATTGKAIALLVLPVSQSPDYSFDAIPVVRSAADPRLAFAVLALLAWGITGTRTVRSRPLALLGLGWFLAALLPTSNLLFPIGTIFGERLLYLPSAGAALTAGAAAGALWDRFARPGQRAPGRIAVAALAAGSLAVLAAATLRYSAAWASDARLFALAAERVPRSVKMRQVNAGILLAGGRPEDALREIDAAAALLPDARTLAIRATILQKLGRDAEARAAAADAVARDPGEYQAVYVSATLARAAGRLDEAEAGFRRTVALRPDRPEAWADLAACRYLAGDPAGALAAARRALGLSDDLPSAWFVSGLSWKALGDLENARAAFQRFVAVAGEGYAAQAATTREALSRGALP